MPSDSFRTPLNRIYLTVGVQSRLHSRFHFQPVEIRDKTYGEGNISGAKSQKRSVTVMMFLGEAVEKYNCKV